MIFAISIFCNLRKAFDTCDHAILIKKLLTMASGESSRTGLKAIFQIVNSLYALTTSPALS